jgi:hypothetical protein
LLLSYFTSKLLKEFELLSNMSGGWVERDLFLLICRHVAIIFAEHILDIKKNVCWYLDNELKQPVIGGN